MLDTMGSAPLVGAAGVNGARPTSPVATRIASGVLGALTPAFLGALATLGGMLLISYGAYMIRPFVGAIVAGACLLVLGKVLSAPAPSVGGGQDGQARPDGYEGMRRR